MLTRQAMLTGEIKPKRKITKFARLARRATVGILPTTEALKLKRDAGELKIAVDSNLMEQAFRELAMNAVKASEPGQVELTITASTSQRETVIEIKDNGPGIPWKDRERVFEPYVALRSAGSGLGLATVRRIVEAHGGTIRVGKARRGGRLIIRIPLLRR